MTFELEGLLMSLVGGGCWKGDRRLRSPGDLTALGAEGKEEEKREINNSDANGFDITGFKTQNSDNCSDRE